MSTALSCEPVPAPRGLWWSVRQCPHALETDAIQLETNELLDMADHLVLSGLAAAGYGLLAVGSCASIQGPTIRAAIQSYIVQRGLSVVFAPQTAERQTARSLALALYTPDADAASTQAAYWRQRVRAGVGRSSGANRSSMGGGGADDGHRCFAEALSAHSGLGVRRPREGLWNPGPSLGPSFNALKHGAALTPCAAPTPRYTGVE